MKILKNKFGEGEIYNIDELPGKISIICEACTSVYSDARTWALDNPDRMVEYLTEEDSVIILSCQVTDLAILNDIRAANSFVLDKHPNVYIGGCLGQRLDIDIPFKRVDVFRGNHNRILPQIDVPGVYWDFPFWVQKDMNTKLSSAIEEGALFRYDRHIQIGAGCHGKCTYCTIRHTRGQAFTADPNEQITALESDLKNVGFFTLVSDSPTGEQITEWLEYAIKNNKKISIRNVEPHVAVANHLILLKAAKKDALGTLHVPIQSMNSEILQDMYRSPEQVKWYIENSKMYRQHGVFLATNIIIDYKGIEDDTQQKVGDFFDYVSWNPLWNGQWDIRVAVERNKKYFPWRR